MSPISRRARSPSLMALARRAKRPLQQAEIVEFEHAAIAEGRQDLFRLLEEDQAAAAKPEARATSDAALEQDGAGDHAAAGIVARIAADDHQPAPHALAEHGSRIAADGEHAAAHAERLADEDAAGALADIAGDGDAARAPCSHPPARRRCL